MSDVAIAGIESRPDGLTIPDGTGFNEWRAYGQRLFSVRERVSWNIGDWWLWGERFAKDYAHGLEELGRAYSFDTLHEYARVCRGFPVRTPKALAWRRTEELSFAHHHHVRSIQDPSERMRWLDDAIRQGWSVAAMREELRFRGAVAVRVEAFSVRVVEEHYRLALEAAARRGIDPREWVLEAIREQAARELATPIATLPQSPVSP